MLKKYKKIFGDLFYSIGAMALMNVVLQFAVYPLVNKTLGEKIFGEMLFWLGIVSVLAPSFGTAVNNARLVFPARDSVKNGDYDYVLLLFSFISFAVTAVIAIAQKYPAGYVLVLGYIVIISVVRNYSTVEYRLSLNYKKQFVFYGILSAGYLMGALLCVWIQNWFWIFILGETFAVAYVVINGTIYRNPWEKSGFIGDIGKRCITLAGAYLMTNLILNMDRFVLKAFLGDTAVSQYYVLSLIGKTIAIIGAPLSSVIIGHISGSKYRISRSQFQKIILLIVGTGVIFWAGAAVVTPVFIKLFYPNLYQITWFSNLVVNGAQILYFLTTLLLVIVLTMCEEKWQLIIQSSYAAVFIVFSIIATAYAGFEGFAAAALISNILYLFFTVLVGLKKSTR